VVHTTAGGDLNEITATDPARTNASARKKTFIGDPPHPAAHKLYRLCVSSRFRPMREMVSWLEKEWLENRSCH
jgi:hypothetical protein